MFRALLELPENSTLAAIITVCIVVVGCMVLSRLARLLIRRVLRTIAQRTARSLAGSGADTQQRTWWRVRSVRVGEDGKAAYEQRRRQRIDAASRMISHLVSLVVWVVGGIATFKLLNVSPTYFLSSFGFVVAAVAIGGQHKVNDYLTGLSVHLEDRYGVGDRISAPVDWDEPIEGVVAAVGLFSTQVRDDRSTVHIANHKLVSVRNLSQEAIVTTLRVRVDDADPGYAADVIGELAAKGDGLTEVVVVGEPTERAIHTGEVEVDLHTAEPLRKSELGRLVQQTERQLGNR